MSEHDSTNAVESLARARQLDSAVRGGSRWFVRYQLIYAAAAGVAVAGIGLVGGNVAAIMTITGLWLATMAALIIYAARQPVFRRGFGRRHSFMIFTWAVLYQAVLFVGMFRFKDNPAWWLAGAVVVALPGLIGAYLESRR